MLDLLGNRSAIYGLGITIALMIFVALTANFAIITYAVTIFQIVGASIDPYVSSIVLAVALILGSLTTTYFADKLGRRALNLVSLLGSAVGLAVCALYHFLYLKGVDLSLFAWVPVVSLSFVTFISAVGISPLAAVCSVENLPSKVLYSFFPPII